METLWRHGFDDGTYSHAFLIPFIVIYLFFELGRSGQLIFRQELTFFSIALLIISGISLFLTSNAQISLGYWLATLAIAASGLIVLFNFSWIVVFPVIYLAFLFPFWGLLTSSLQNLSISAVTFIMNFTGIPTYVDGALINIPAGIFEIADGCSGLRYFIVSTAISSLFIFLYIKNIKRAGIFFAVAILGALVTNWIRITALIIIGEYTNMESSLMEDHNTFGWYIYIPFMLLLFKWGNTLIDNDIFQNSRNATLTNKTSSSVVIFILSVLILSSTTLKSYVNQKPTVQKTHTVHLERTSPKVYFYSDIEEKEVYDKDNSYKIFHFDGSELDGKPSYYDNNYLPQGYVGTASKVTEGWNVHFAQSTTESIAILYKYEFNNTTYTNLRSLKLARIKNAILTNNETKIHWVYLTCKSSCEFAINRFVKAQTDIK